MGQAKQGGDASFLKIREAKNIQLSESCPDANDTFKADFSLLNQDQFKGSSLSTRF